MNCSFYTAAVGAANQQERLDVHGNNIANINTYGFKAGKPTFTQLMYGMVDGIEGEELPRGTGSRLDAADTDFSPTSLHETGFAYDYAIEGWGFFALMDPATGDYTYSRDGSFAPAQFQINGQTGWYLSDGVGRLVMGQDGRPIEIEHPEVSQPVGDPLNVGIFDFINYNGMKYQGDNRFNPVDKNGQVRRGSGKLIQGYLEDSNADLANEFTKVIETQRSFTYMLKMVSASDEIETTVNNLR